MTRLVAHAGPLDADQLRQPKTVLVAGSLPPVVTSTVVWLNEMGIDIALQRVQAYRVRVGESDGIVVSASGGEARWASVRWDIRAPGRVERVG